jgi:hypothetical protein
MKEWDGVDLVIIGGDFQARLIEKPRTPAGIF